MNVIKVTLPTKKVVFLREPQISDIEKASQSAGNMGSNQTHINILMQKELLKSLLVKVDDKDMSMKDKTNLDAIFTTAEYFKLQKIMEKITGDSGNEESVMEFVSSTEQ